VSEKLQVHLFILNQIVSFFIRILSISLSFDIELFHGKSTRQPNVNQFIDIICERLHQTIEVYEKTPLSKMRF
jgi:hypothetical protein